MTKAEDTFSAFRTVPKTGVIYVTTEAQKLGYKPGEAPWCNLGQGQPETGDFPQALTQTQAPERKKEVSIHPDDQEYAPVAGLPELRAQVAEFYNHTYRRGAKSQYTAENVCISSGGRVALSRAAAALSQINLGHFLPDYTAYEELLGVFSGFTAIPILLEAERGYALPVDDLRREITGRGLSALLLSNPNNPTGKLVQGEELQRWLHLARSCECTLLCDEFYSHYIWAGRPGQLPVESIARYVQDVDRDPVVIFDGLTKNWRYPGWRVSWTVGPRSVIEAVASAGSFLDGGGSRPLQRAAIPLLSEDHVRRETLSTHEVFRSKRDRMLSRLERMGIRFERPPEGTFYCWGNVSGLPEGLSEGMGFFRAALGHQVIVVPGEFFDINPGKRRHAGSRFRHHVRFSFGPPKEVLDTALDRLEAMVLSAA